MRTWKLALMVGILAGLACSAIAVTPGQVDDFEDGTTEGWGTGSTGGPNNVTTGGPTGANDNYMQMNSSGSGGSGGRLIVFNQSQWSGDFTAPPPITAISMDFKNFTASVLSMRIAVKASTGNGRLMFDVFAVPVDSNWHHAVFNLDAGSLTAVNAPDPLPTLLAGVIEMRLLAAASPAGVGDAVAGPLGVDNITALAPEPSALGLVGVACALALRRVRDRSTLS